MRLLTRVSGIFDDRKAMLNLFRDLADRFSRTPGNLQRLVGLVCGLTSFVVIILNVLVEAKKTTPHLRPIDLLSNISISLVLLTGIVGLVSAYWKSRAALWFQIAILFLIAALSSLTAYSGNLTGAIFLIFGLLLVAEYELRGVGVYLSGAFAVVAYPFMLAIGYSRHTRGYLYATGASLLVVIVLVILYGGVLYRHFWRHRQEALLLEKRVLERTGELSRALDDRELAVSDLKRASAEREKTVEELRRALAERDVAMKELNHRVKNNLNLVLSLIHLEVNKVEEDGVRQILEASTRRIRALYLVHEILFQTGQLGQIEIKSYVERLLAELARTTGSSVVLDVSVSSETVVDLDFAVPFGLLLNELVVNAVLHAFPNGRGGTVTVRLDAEASVQLVIADDGVGLPEDFQFESARSLGLPMVAALVDQLDGRLELDRSSGTTWRVFLPQGR